MRSSDTHRGYPQIELEVGRAEDAALAGHSEETGRSPGGALVHMAVVVAILGGATAVALLLRRFGVTETSVVMVYFLSVLLASMATSRLFGIAASVVAVVLFNFLFTEPRFTFVVNDQQYLVTFPIMLAVAAISSELTTRIRRQAEEAAMRERQTELLYRSSRALLGAQGDELVAVAAIRHLAGLLSRGVCCTLPPAAGGAVRSFGSDPSAACLPDTVCAADLLAEISPMEEKDKDGSVWLHVPIRTHSQTLAVISVNCGGAALGNDLSAPLNAVAVQLALALDRERVSRNEQHARLEIERERLRGNLLQSISHDLRTPLAAIVGASSTLLDDPDIDETAKAELLHAVRDDARWLTGLVENLLSLTRAEASSIRVHGTVEVLDDVISSALTRMERMHDTHTLRVELADEPVLVKMDGSLLEQLVINLLDNAIQHTPKGTTVTVAVRREVSSVELVVSDDGPGLSRGALTHAFERFFTERPIPDGRRGMGLGLAICKSIAEAHGGAIRAGNREGGGARFTVTLPVREEDSIRGAAVRGE